MFDLSVKDVFSAAHRLENYKGKCEELHGHNFFVEAVFTGDTLGSDGMLMDFKVLKQYLKSVLNTLDHKYINQIPFFSKRASSSEYLAMYIFLELKKCLTNGKVFLKEVRVWESESACAAYRG